VGRVEEWAISPPARALRGLVAGYHGYRQAGLPPARHIGLPSPHLTLILTLEEPLTVAAHPDPQQPPATYAALLGGLHTAPALITHQGSQAGVQVSLHPLAARAVLGLPAGELASADLPAADVLGSFVERAREALLASRTWPERFAALDRLLQARLAAAGPDAACAPPPEVVHGWRLLRSTGGRVSVSTLARETGWSARHLAAVMARETGLTPKAAARVIRFDRARRAVAAAGGARLAQVAAETGYADQSHLDREFRALAGLAPSRWYAHEFRNVQAGEDADPARSGP
jgi:AraC-like DNA-binding protein